MGYLYLFSIIAADSCAPSATTRPAAGYSTDRLQDRGQWRGTIVTQSSWGGSDRDSDGSSPVSRGGGGEDQRRTLARPVRRPHLINKHNTRRDVRVSPLNLRLLRDLALSQSTISLQCNTQCYCSIIAHPMHAAVNGGQSNAIFQTSQ